MDWLSHLIPAIQNYSSFGYWLIFLISFFEALIFIGSFIPGTFIIIFYGFLAASGYFNVVDLFILATSGAILGDGASFYLGTKSQELFHEKNFLLNTKYLEKSQKFFNKHGDKSIFWGRFIGIIKPFIPFVAGLSGMNTKKFVFWNIFSALVWATAHLAVGYFFGGAFKVIEVWTTRLGLFTIVCFFFFLFFWLAIKKGEKALEYTNSFIQSTGWSVINSFPVRWLYHRFPKLYLFIINRLKKDSFWGLPFSLLVLSFLIVVLSLFDITKDVLVSNPVVVLDMKIENLLAVFRDSFLIKFFLWITALGEFPVIVSGVLVMTALFWLWKKRFYILSLWLTVAGSAASAYIAKMFINRARPGGNIPVYTEHFFSFPSGHSASIIALFGFLIYCIWKNFTTWKIRVNSFFILGAVILFVGFSRLYLGVHFLSDVLGGYLIGFFWLLIGITVSEWLIIKNRRRGGADLIKEVKTERQVSEQIKILRFFTGLLIFTEIFYVASFIIGFKPIFNSVAQTAERQIVVRDLSDPLFEKYLPKFPENLTGDYQAPLNFILIAKDDETVYKLFQDSSWSVADSISLKSLGRLIRSYFENFSYDNAPVAPLFWHGQTNDFAFGKNVSDGSFGARYEIRFWKTDIATEDGGYVYVGLADFNLGSEYILFRKISADLDIARNRLFNDIFKSQLIMSYEKKALVDNVKGDYYEKGKYNTDGDTYIIYLK